MKNRMNLEVELIYAVHYLHAVTLFIVFLSRKHVFCTPLIQEFVHREGEALKCVV